MEYYDGLALRTANAMGEHGIKREGKTLLDLDYVDTRPYPGGGVESLPRNICPTHKSVTKKNIN